MSATYCHDFQWICDRYAQDVQSVLAQVPECRGLDRHNALRLADHILSQKWASVVALGTGLNKMSEDDEEGE